MGVTEGAMTQLKKKKKKKEIFFFWSPSHLPSCNHPPPQIAHQIEKQERTKVQCRFNVSKTR
jgi:ssDNA-binding Zn-finger/Zn-ribbon topoisomerase 1